MVDNNSQTPTNTYRQQQVETLEKCKAAYLQSAHAGRVTLLTTWIDTWNDIAEEWVLAGIGVAGLGHLRPRKDPGDFSDSDEDSVYPIYIDEYLNH